MPISTTLVIMRSVVGQQPLVVGTCRARPVADAVAREQDLPDDLGRIEVAHEALRARVAEAASQRAAHLRGDAQRAAVALRNVDGLDLGRPRLVPALRQPQQPLARAVDGDLLGDDLGPVERVELFEPGAQLLRDVGHLVERGHAADVEPAPQLDDAHAHAAFPARRPRPCASRSRSRERPARLGLNVPVFGTASRCGAVDRAASCGHI